MQAISVDVAAVELLPPAFSGKVDLTVDHHQKNTLYSENKLVKPMYSSCGEIIFQLITRLCGSLTKQEAELLYIAVSTDTGCFQYSNTSYHTLNTAAKLLKYGIDNASLNDLLFRKVNRSRIVLESMIYSSMQYYRNDTISVVTITQKMLEDSGAADEDLDDVASLACRPKNAKLCITIRERTDGKCRISLRSFDGINCVDICSVFGGSGHISAAGCTISAGPKEACEMLLSVIDEVLK
jgi:phosphoesterase RecJ-like protein